MWVFDGESWEEDNGATDEVKRRKEVNDSMPHFEEFYPELQVIEIVPVPQTTYVPPFPLP